MALETALLRQVLCTLDVAQYAIGARTEANFHRAINKAPPGALRVGCDDAPSAPRAPQSALPMIERALVAGPSGGLDAAPRLPCPSKFAAPPLQSRQACADGTVLQRLLLCGRATRRSAAACGAPRPPPPRTCAATQRPHRLVASSHHCSRSSLIRVLVPSRAGRPRPRLVVHILNQTYRGRATIRAPPRPSSISTQSNAPPPPPLPPPAEHG